MLRIIAQPIEQTNNQMINQELFWVIFAISLIKRLAGVGFEYVLNAAEMVREGGFCELLNRFVCFCPLNIKMDAHACVHFGSKSSIPLRFAFGLT